MRLDRLAAFLLVFYCLIGVAFLFEFNSYLERPIGEWKRIDAHISSRNHGEPIVFEPSWWMNYAVDKGRFRGLEVSADAGDFEVFWLVSGSPAPRDCTVLSDKSIGRAHVMKVEKKTLT